MKNLTIETCEFNPRKNIIPKIMYIQMDWKNNSTTRNDSLIQVPLLEEPLWWNRPLKSDTLIKLEEDGLYSVNMPLMHDIGDYKSNYNTLLAVNTVPIAIHLKIDPSWTEEQISNLFIMTRQCTRNALVRLGVDESHLAYVHNDILYDNKKFMGAECGIKAGMYSENTVITMRYKPEEEVFDRLKGRYAKSRKITGIIEETELFTQAQFIDMLFDEIKKFLATYE